MSRLTVEREAELRKEAAMAYDNLNVNARPHAFSLLEVFAEVDGLRQELEEVRVQLAGWEAT